MCLQAAFDDPDRLIFHVVNGDWKGEGVVAQFLLNALTASSVAQNLERLQCVIEETSAPLCFRALSRLLWPSRAWSLRVLTQVPALLTRCIESMAPHDLNGLCPPASRPKEFTPGNQPALAHAWLLLWPNDECRRRLLDAMDLTKEPGWAAFLHAMSDTHPSFVNELPQFPELIRDLLSLLPDAGFGNGSEEPGKEGQWEAFDLCRRVLPLTSWQGDWEIARYLYGTPEILDDQNAIELVLERAPGWIMKHDTWASAAFFFSLDAMAQKGLVLSDNHLDSVIDFCLWCMDFTDDEGSPTGFSPAEQGVGYLNSKASALAAYPTVSTRLLSEARGRGGYSEYTDAAMEAFRAFVGTGSMRLDASGWELVEQEICERVEECRQAKEDDPDDDWWDVEWNPVEHVLDAMLANGSYDSALQGFADTLSGRGCPAMDHFADQIAACISSGKPGVTRRPFRVDSYALFEDELNEEDDLSKSEAGKQEGVGRRDGRSRSDGSPEGTAETAKVLSDSGGRPEVRGATKRSDREGDFIRELQQFGGHAGNTRLRKALAWNAEVYDAVKGELLRQRRITLGCGRGGSVTLATEHSDSVGGNAGVSQPAANARGTCETTPAVDVDRGQPTHTMTRTPTYSGQHGARHPTGDASAARHGAVTPAVPEAVHDKLLSPGFTAGAGAVGPARLAAEEYGPGAQTGADRTTPRSPPNDRESVSDRASLESTPASTVERLHELRDELWEINRDILSTRDKLELEWHRPRQSHLKGKVRTLREERQALLSAFRRELEGAAGSMSIDRLDLKSLQEFLEVFRRDLA
ncbi:MAG: hypothetical protein HN341_14175 [Verrucomicrobia bacterium]|nr:hypothetical protein [Verrucomicrobiota bacterium]